MGRNETCWCGSGQKYKKCHLDREHQDPVNIFEAEGKLFAMLREGYCSHPDQENSPCSSKIIKAHTIQKSGGIAEIAEAGHVLTVKPTMKGMIESQGQPNPRKVGVKNASVFPGFCNRHDTELFKPIEGKTLTLGKDTAFLFSYRAISYERFAKEVQLRGVPIQREGDRGLPFQWQAMIQKYLHLHEAGVRIGLRDAEQWKKEFDDLLIQGSLDLFHYLAVRFDCVLPVVACGAFHPEFDASGAELQQLGRESKDYEHMSVNVTTFGGQTIVVFGWVGTNVGPASAFVDSFESIPDERKADVLVRLLFLQTENVYLRPSWWEALDELRRVAYRKLLMSGTPTRMRSASEYMDDGVSVITADVVESVRG
nr:SEC-C metal-binding domain-containing protein [Vannielia litorea]